MADDAFDGMNLGPALTAALGALPTSFRLEKLPGDASTRSYYRLHLPDGPVASVMVMRLPADALASDEGQGGVEVHELPFINVHRLLSERGVRVPRILADATEQGVLILEDLGDETFLVRLSRTAESERVGLYRSAIALLADMHARCTPESPGSLSHRRAFDAPLLRWELDHFREWGLEALDLSLSDAERRRLDEAFDGLVARIVELPQGFVHRDYQSRNLMWRDDELVVIDFQDALQGPMIYDVVSLLCDSYVTLDEATQRALVQHYAALRGLDSSELERAFWMVAAQRKLKDAGRFVFIDQVRENPGFLPWYERSLRYAGRALSKLPALEAVNQLLAEKIAGFPDAVAQPAARTGKHRGRSL